MARFGFYDNKMILITGAAGKTGRAVIRALAERHGQADKGEFVRALVHRPEQVNLVRQLGAEEVVVGELQEAPTLNLAMQDIRAIYFICSNMNPDELAIGKQVITTACANNVEYLVYHSVLHPQVEAMPHHWQKLRVEEKIFESGLHFAILQPAAYMQNILAQWEAITWQGVYPVPYAVETRLGMVDLEDVAESAAKILLDTHFAGGTYELAGAEALTQVEVAAILGHSLGRAVRPEHVARAAWEARSRAAGLSEYAIGTLLKMFAYYEEFGFWGNPAILTWLLGHQPVTFGQFVKRVAAETNERRR